MLAITFNSYLIHKPSGLGAKNIHITIPYTAIIAPGTTNDRPQSSSTKDPEILRFVYLSNERQVIFFLKFHRVVNSSMKLDK